MQIINSGRGSGKTYTLVQWVKDEPDTRAIVVATHFQREWLIKEHGLSGGQVLHIADVSRALQGRRNMELAFDEFDRVLGWLLSEHTSSAKVAILAGTVEEIPTIAQNFTKKPFGDDTPTAHTCSCIHSDQTRQLIELGQDLGEAVKKFLGNKPGSYTDTDFGDKGKKN